MFERKKMVVFDSVFDEKNQKFTRMIDSKGEVTLCPESLDFCLDLYLLQCGRSRKVNRLSLLPYLCESRCVPIYVSPDNILLPYLSTLCPLTNKKACSYVCSSAISHIKDSQIHLNTGDVLTFKDAPKTFHQRRHNSSTINKLFSSDFHPDVCKSFLINPTPFDKLLEDSDDFFDECS